MKYVRRNPFEGRLKREFETVQSMIDIYCEAKHGETEKLCTSCAKLLDYAESKVEVCPFGTQKPQCTKCEIHCYSDTKREEVRQVMRFAGPRMLYKHPLKTIMHYADAIRDGSRKKAQTLIKERQNKS